MRITDQLMKEALAHAVRTFNTGPTHTEDNRPSLDSLIEQQRRNIAVTQQATEIANRLNRTMEEYLSIVRSVD